MAEDVYLEVGAKRVFACALDWPGWARSAKSEDEAVQALLGYGDRYRAAVSGARQGFRAPAAVRVAERVKGNATTDFGAPGIEASSDGKPISEKEAKRLAALLRACWAAFGRAAEAATGTTLRTGPRGGGRNRTKIIGHVLEAERAYLGRIGGRYDTPSRGGQAAEMEAAHEAYLEAFLIRAGGGEPPKPPARAALWSPRYAVRRAAWHVLDHAWEIEDRAGLA